MVSNEQIAHELTMLYLYNRYGNLLGGNFSCGYGSIATFRFPDATKPGVVEVKTGEKGFLGIEKTKRVTAGSMATGYFKGIIEEYRCAYKQILELLET